jgi:carbamoyl-phosphate synthase large subunit
VKEPVLVTSAGTVVAQGIMKSLRLANSRGDATMRYKLITADMSPKAAGLYRSDVGVIVPPADSAGYLDAIMKLCKEEKVRAIFVGSEEELAPLSENSQRVERETGAVVLADARAVAIGRDKWKTFEHMTKAGLPCAASALPADRDRFVGTGSSGFL